MSFLPKGRSFTANSGTKAAVLLKGRSSTANSGTRAAVLLGMDRCGSFPLLSTLHSLFSIWIDLKRPEKILRAPTWRWGECIWLTGPSGLHINSPQGLNIGSIRISDQIRDPEIPINLHPRIYSKGLTFLQVIYESFDCDLTQKCWFMISIKRYDLINDRIYLLKSWIKTPYVKS